MPSQSDQLALAIIVIAAALWLYARIRRWLRSPLRLKLPFPEAEPVPASEAVRLLEEAGYEVLSGKKKVPLIVEIDEEEPKDTRLFVDLFARRDHELFVVKVSNQRQPPVQWTASGVRDRFMIYHHLFKETHGLLYVDLEQQRVRKIRIDIGELE